MCRRPAPSGGDNLTRRSSGVWPQRPATAEDTITGTAPHESKVGDGWRLIARQMLAQRWGLLFGVAAGLAWTAAKVSVPKLIEGAIDEGMAVGDGGAVMRYAWLIAGAGLVCALFTGVRRYSAFREARYAEAVLRDRLFAHLTRLHFAYHDGQQTGQLMSRANTDLQQIQNAVVLVPLTIANLATVVAAVVLLLFIDPLLTLLAVGTLPLNQQVAKRFAQKLQPSQVAIQQESAELAAVVEETVGGIRVVKGFAAEETQAARLATEADDLYDVSMQAAGIRSRYWPVLDMLPNIGLILVLAYGGHRVMSGDLALGSLVAFNAYVALLVWPLRMLGWIVAMAQRAAASAQRVHEVLVTGAEVADPELPVDLPPSGGHVRFEGVTFGYGTGSIPVLDGFDLEIPAGQTVALVGATASGKSTVAKLIPRFYDVQAGSVSLDGVDVRHIDLRSLRRSVGLVFEETFLFSDTVGANIAFADPEASFERIRRAAALSGAAAFIDELPLGYDTEIGERGFSLSGGQRQRIAIARAILADPRVLVLDDATSAVDPAKEHEIRDALAEVMRDRTTIVIAHRPATIALAERVILIGDGRVLADGTHAHLLATDRRYQEVLAAAEAHEEQLRHADRSRSTGTTEVPT